MPGGLLKQGRKEATNLPGELDMGTEATSLKRRIPARDLLILRHMKIPRKTNELVDQLHIPKRSVRYALSRLEALELVWRYRDFKGDARHVIWAQTQLGNAVAS